MPHATALFPAILNHHATWLLSGIKALICCIVLVSCSWFCELLVFCFFGCWPLENERPSYRIIKTVLKFWLWQIHVAVVLKRVESFLVMIEVFSAASTVQKALCQALSTFRLGGFQHHQAAMSHSKREIQPTHAEPIEPVAKINRLR